MAAMFHKSFRFSQDDLHKLDKLVSWERTKGPTLYPSMQPNRTSILKALIERELLRLQDEEVRIQERLAGVKADARAFLDGMESGKENPKQRKSRLQRERRTARRAQAG